MKRCSYTWFDLIRLIEKQCPEEIWKGSAMYCIFHDPSLKKDIALFNQKLQEKVNREDYEFLGYYFPEEVHFENRKFEKDASFWGATFNKDASFWGATFQKDADFREATFQKDAYFRGATFQKDAYFRGATFNKDASFWRATFQIADFKDTTFNKADFREAVVERNLNFNTKSVKEFDLRSAQFLFKGRITTDLSETRFHQADLENVAFIDCIWPEKIHEDIHMEDKELSFSELETIYRDLRRNMQRHGNQVMAGKFYYREMEMRRKGTKNVRSRIWLEVYRLLAGYGERPDLTVLSSFLTISVFALLYWIFECLQYSVESPTTFQKIKDAIYFSFVTFTTLGLGDIRPLSDLGKFLICCEAVFGAFLIALFVVVFARKMMR